jgi:hypothetical protein
MRPSPRVAEFLAELERFAGKHLLHKDDLGILVELSLPDRLDVLDDLGFHAKFLVRSRAILKRIGPHGDGYDRILGESLTASRHISEQMNVLLMKAPAAVRDHFEQKYFRRQIDAYGSLVHLCETLGWYKNWRIDHKDPSAFLESQ